MIKLIAGLGNPGEKYAATRHNLGFRAIDRLLEESPPKEKRVRANTVLFDTEKFGLLCKPLTYMNRSGNAILSVSRELELSPQEVLILYDDFALELGMIRVRAHGSSGGHNGLQSVIEKTETTHVPRVRLGIKTDEMDSWVDFVLTEFKKSERKIVDEMLDTCCDCVEYILRNGIVAAMNKFNRKQQT